MWNFEKAERYLNRVGVIFLLVLSNTYCQQSYCGSFVPMDLASCTAYSTNSQYCCLLRTYTNQYYDSMCYPIDPTQYMSLNGNIQLGGYSYQVDCGNSIGTDCGQVPEPISYKDCSIYSLNSNSCCYISYKNVTSCVWLGSPNTGKVEYKGLTIICDGSILNLGTHYFTFLFILISFLFF